MANVGSRSLAAGDYETAVRALREALEQTEGHVREDNIIPWIQSGLGNARPSWSRGAVGERGRLHCRPVDASSMQQPAGDPTLLHRQGTVQAVIVAAPPGFGDDRP